MKLFVYVFGSIGVLLLIGAGILYIYFRNFMAKAEHVQGTIVKMNDQRIKGGEMYYPSVQFTTKAGETYTVKRKVTVSSQYYGVAENANVYYNPEDPTDVLFPDFSLIKKTIAILWKAGLFFALLGIGLGYFFYTASESISSC